MESKNKSGKKKRYIIIIAILLIPFISIFLIIHFRRVVTPTNDEIIQYIIDAKAYKTEATYTIENSKGEFEEEVEIYHKKDLGFRVEFQEDRVKIYKNGYINVQENDEEYEVDEGMDSLYPLGFIGNILSNEIIDINEGTEEWGDIKYLVVDVQLSSKNNHLYKAKVYINKEDKSPIVTKIYNNEDEERVIIVYDDFEYLKDIDKNLF